MSENTKGRIVDHEEAISFLRSCGATCSPRQLARVLGGNPYQYNVQAKNGKLRFEFDWHGSSLRIYTQSVINRVFGG